MSGTATIETAGGPMELRLLGERLCLDFANTVDVRRSDHPREFLTDYGDLVEWSHHAGTLSEAERDRLLAVATAYPTAEVRRAFAAALSLRDAVYRTFASIAAGGIPEEVDLAAIGEARARAAAHQRLAPAGPTAFGWVWDDDLDALERPLWPIAASAAELLTEGRLDRVRECPGSDGCGWLFLDTSKNGSRRWCSMEGCGNRAKARRFLARQANVRRGDRASSSTSRGA